MENQKILIIEPDQGNRLLLETLLREAPITFVSSTDEFADLTTLLSFDKIVADTGAFNAHNISPFLEYLQAAEYQGTILITTTQHTRFPERKEEKYYCIHKPYDINMIATILGLEAD
jgi:CheY-like chemotaxis protein